MNLYTEIASRVHYFVHRFIDFEKNAPIYDVEEYASSEENESFLEYPPS